MQSEISIGELVDKVSILKIKLEKIQNPDKRRNILHEFTILSDQMEQAGILLQSPEFLGLKRINLKLWQIEDDIRLKEQKKEFDEGFILLARSVYFSNDQRTTLKREINLKFASDLVEEKEYTSYQ